MKIILKSVKKEDGVVKGSPVNFLQNNTLQIIAFRVYFFAFEVLRIIYR
ncbi:hypothetical protein [Mucilaginibacter pallidiroseus]|nr:hypothetical protein [Mucilaginibacter pallidiroseus]